MMILKIFTSYFLKNNIFWLILLFINVSIVSGSSSYFSGLPWNQNIETIFLTVFFPIIILFYKKLELKYYLKFIIIIVLFFKVISFFSPTLGINHQQYVSNSKNNNFVISYDTFWNKNYTTVQKYSWVKKRNFPLEWINYSDETFYPEFFTSVNWDEIDINHKINFYLVVNKKIDFEIFTDQTHDDFLNYFNLNDENPKKFYFNKEKLTLSDGIYKFYGEVKFTGKNFSFVPYVKYNDKKKKAIENRFIFSDLHDYNNLNLINLHKIVSLISDLTIIFLFLVIIINIFKNTFIKNNIFIYFLSFLLIFLCFFLINYLNIFLPLIGTYDYLGVWPISLTFLSLFVLIILIRYNTLFNLHQSFDYNFQNIFIIISPVYFFFWIYHFKNDLQSFSFWTIGDDWLGFQYFARKIVFENDWIGGGEGVFYFRPLLRYIISLLHILFGDSSFSLKFIDVWAVLISSFVVYKILISKKTSNYLSFISCLIIIIIFTGENFRYLIGRGLSEYFGMLILMSLVYYLYDRKIKVGVSLFFIILLIATIPYTREEKIFAALALIFMSLNYNYIKNISNNIFVSIFRFFYKEFKLILFYFLILIIMFPILFEFRNYFLSGYLSITSHEFVNQGLFQGGFESYYKMLTAETFPNFPRITSIFLFSSFVFSLLAIFYRKIYEIIDIRFSIILLSLIIPTIFHNIHGYNPRYVIYTFPLSVLIFFYFLDNLIKIIKKRNAIINK